MVAKGAALMVQALDAADLVYLTIKDAPRPKGFWAAIARLGWLSLVAERELNVTPVDQLLSSQRSSSKAACEQVAGLSARNTCCGEPRYICCAVIRQ